MVFGANTYRAHAQMLASSTEESEVRDPWVTRMRNLPATVLSTTLQGPLDWPDATVVSGDVVDVVARLKEESKVPLRSHGSLSLNRALMAAGLVDRVQVTLFPVITGQTGEHRTFQGARLRPRADREPDARRQHPRAHLPAHPACLSPSMHPPLVSRVRSRTVAKWIRDRVGGAQVDPVPGWKVVGVCCTARPRVRLERGSQRCHAAERGARWHPTRLN
jgi:dihydrofolate reductase